MMLHKAPCYVKLFTTCINWKTRIKQTMLVDQISTILLQRHNWISLLQSLNLSSKLTPPLFLQILRRTQHNPQLSLNFFNWITTNLHFKPDLKCQCLIIHLAHESAQMQLIKPILDSLAQSYSAEVVTRSIIQAGMGRDSQSDALSFAIECYSDKVLFVDGLVVYKMMRVYGYVPSIKACNKLLDAMYRENEMRLIWCLYGAMFRDGILPDEFTWSLVAQILLKIGKFGMILRLLSLGIYNSVMYNLVIDCYSKSGGFSAAIKRLNEMCDGRKLKPGFSTYSSILDGACKFANFEVADRIMHIMVEKGMLPKSCASGNDSIIQKLCDLGKTYAAEKIFKRACDEEIGLQHITYGCMLRAFSEEGRVKEAIRIYHLILEKDISVNGSSYYAFINALCKADQSEGVWESLMDIIKRGYSPSAMELSKFTALQCDKGRWGEVEELLNVIVEKDLLLDSFCCCSLMKHYCTSGQIDKAIALHTEMEKLKSSLDLKTYNALLEGVFKAGRIEEAVKVFDYMKRLNLVNNLSFVIMIGGLCHVKELRKAMKLHDQMLKMGLKPDEATYKRLISGFN